MKLETETLHHPARFKIIESRRQAGAMIPGYKEMVCVASGGGAKAVGLGAGRSKVAAEKAKSEAYERLAYRLLRVSRKLRASGWSAHPDASRALEDAGLELIERDVALRAWERRGPYHKIPRSLWPAELARWKQACPRGFLFPKLEAMVCAGRGATAIVLLANAKGNFVAGHAARLDLQDALLSAFDEALRASYLVHNLRHVREVERLHDFSRAGGGMRHRDSDVHRLAYAYRRARPRWLRPRPAARALILNLWRRNERALRALLSSRETRLLEIKLGTRTIVHVTHPTRHDLTGAGPRPKRNKLPYFN